MIIFRYLSKNIYTYFLFVFIGFIGLFVILDFISESKDVNNQYNYAWAMGQVLLRTIYYLYQFIPIAVLIACVLATVKLSQQSEFVIMRMHGLSLAKILKLMTLIGLPLIILTFSLGEYLVPLSAKLSQEIKQRLLQKTHLDLKSGFWLKYQDINQNRQYILRITQLNPLNNLANLSSNDQIELKKIQSDAPDAKIFASIYLYEFTKHSNDQQLAAIYFSKYASVNQKINNQKLTLHFGRKIDLEKQSAQNVLKIPNNSNNSNNSVASEKQQPLFTQQNTNTIHKVNPFDQIELDFHLPPGFIEYLGVKNKAKNMTLMQLREYISFLKSNQQNTYDYELNLWQKYVYPFTNLIMLWLGGVFIYFKQRQPKQVYIFVVIMAGLMIYLGQTILLQIAQLNTWPPPWVALAPLLTGLFILMALHMYLQRK
jgi:lipopolysaccharide export LptBFGC system permease protein LptF